jgi:SAM-dependent methyltransferase
VIGVPVDYREPSPSGVLPVSPNSIDLVLCLGVLHHIPNVSTIVTEIGRVLKSGGYALISEPTVSMGDASLPRPGLTPHERGIPLSLLRVFVRDADLEILRESRWGFPLTSRLSRVAGSFGIDTTNSATLTRFDALASRSVAWNQTYHATTLRQKIRPASVFLVLRKMPKTAF